MLDRDPTKQSSPEPQDVRGSESSAWGAFWVSEAARGHKYEDAQAGFRAGWKAALAQSDAQPVGLTDAQIVEQTNELARRVLRFQGYEAPKDFRFDSAPPENIRANRAWKFAAEIQEFMTATDVENALANVDEDTPALAQSDAQPVGLERLPDLTFWYRNYRGEISQRRVIIRNLRWLSNEYHLKPQWLLFAYDMDKEAEREFAVKDMAPTRDALKSDAQAAARASGEKGGAR